MDYKYKLDRTTPFFYKYNQVNGFIETFMKVKFKNDNDEFVYGSIKNVTPTTLKKSFVLEVPKEIKSSKEAYLSINIRNKEYVYKLI